MVKITKIQSGWYETNAYALELDSLDNKAMQIEICRSEDDHKLWHLVPIERNLNSKKEAVSLLITAISSGRYNYFVISTGEKTLIDIIAV